MTNNSRKRKYSSWKGGFYDEPCSGWFEQAS